MYPNDESEKWFKYSPAKLQRLIFTFASPLLFTDSSRAKEINKAITTHASPTASRTWTAINQPE